MASASFVRDTTSEVTQTLRSCGCCGPGLRPDMHRDLVIDALKMAWFGRDPGNDAALIFHSNRGSQYASEDFAQVLGHRTITPSMSRKGYCWDNACSETLFGSLKVEWLHGQRFETIRQAKDETIAWLLCITKHGCIRR